MVNDMIVEEVAITEQQRAILRHACQTHADCESVVIETPLTLVQDHFGSRKQENCGRRWPAEPEQHRAIRWY